MLMRWAGHVARMGEDRGVHRCWWGNLRERDHWRDQDVDERISRWIFRKSGGGGSRGDWMELAQDRDRWRALVGTGRNFRVP
jgi:hypothetical protein